MKAEGKITRSRNFTDGEGDREAEECRGESSGGWVGGLRNEVKFESRGGAGCKGSGPVTKGPPTWKATGGY